MMGWLGWVRKKRGNGGYVYCTKEVLYVLLLYSYRSYRWCRQNKHEMHECVWHVMFYFFFVCIVCYVYCVLYVCVLNWLCGGVGCPCFACLEAGAVLAAAIFIHVFLPIWCVIMLGTYFSISFAKIECMCGIGRQVPLQSTCRVFFFCWWRLSLFICRCYCVLLLLIVLVCSIVRAYTCRYF